VTLLAVLFQALDCSTGGFILASHPDVAPNEGRGEISYQRFVAPCLALLAGGVTGLFLSGGLESHATQNPTVSLDMVTSGNTYDDSTNSMAVGSIESCLTSATANPTTHIHPAHLVIQNVEDLLAWQVRFNYIGDRMRPSTVNVAPFQDNNTGQSVSFLNLPIDPASGLHRDVLASGGGAPAAPPDGTNTPQTHAVGATYIGRQDSIVSPDTPAKVPPDDGSYQAPSGGVLAVVNLQVVGDESSQASLFMNLDDAFPQLLGSGVAVFDGAGVQEIKLSGAGLGDGFHGEGANCTPIDCVNQECPPVDVREHTFTNQNALTASDLHIRFSGNAAGRRLVQNAPGCPEPSFSPAPGFVDVDVDWGVTCVDPGESVVIEITSQPLALPECFQWSVHGEPIGACELSTSTPTPTPTPSLTPTASSSPGTPTPGAGVHDGRAKKIGAANTVVLSDGTPDVKEIHLQVRNEGDHAESFGVYVDVLPPSGTGNPYGCSPAGRVVNTIVTLEPDEQVVVAAFPTFRCTDVASPQGQTYTIASAVDVHADDGNSCRQFEIQTMGCFNSLADDDNDARDNRASKNAFMLK
jgi:hypothetical protein